MEYEETFKKIFNKESVWYTDSDGRDWEAVIEVSMKSGTAIIKLLKTGRVVSVSLDELHA